VAWHVLSVSENGLAVLHPGGLMRSFFLAVVFVLSIAALPGTVHAQEAAKKPESVALRFAWPEKLTTEVSYQRTRTRTGKPTSTFSARFTRTALKQDDTIRLTESGTKWEGDMPFPQGLVQDAIQASEGLVQVVNTDGEFVALEGIESLRPVLAKMFASMNLPKEQAERTMALSEAMMRADAQEMWMLGVGFWSGGDLEFGARYTMRNEAEVPLVPGLTAQYAVEFSAQRRVPCNASEKVSRCVELKLRSVPDAESLPKITRALVTQLAGPTAKLPADAIQQLTIENELVLVTEPATLVPHRLVWTKGVNVTVKDGGQTRKLEQLDRREYDYRYAVAAKPKP